MPSIIKGKVTGTKGRARTSCSRACSRGYIASKAKVQEKKLYPVILKQCFSVIDGAMTYDMSLYNIDKPVQIHTLTMTALPNCEVGLHPCLAISIEMSSDWGKANTASKGPYRSGCRNIS